METMDKINIVLKEYDSLKKEIEARTNNGYQLLPIAGVVFAWLFSRTVDARSWAVIVVSAIFFSFAAWMIFRDIRKAAARVSEIECQVNELAEMDLLKWETVWGMAATGFFKVGPFWGSYPKISR